MWQISDLEQDTRLDGAVSAGQRVARFIRPGKVRDALHGVWLGHPLHPMLIQATIGTWLSASILDFADGDQKAARRLVTAGLAVRPKTAAEKAFCALGPVAEAFITGAAAAGNTRLGPELAELNTLRAAHGEQAFGAALDRAVAFGRWRAADVRSILAAGPGTADPRAAGDALVLELPVVPVRPLSDYAIGGLS